ncbi:MAG: ABC transporter permease [Prevotella sp.]|nr:ABC transporter permease [Prevotella sp.]
MNLPFYIARRYLFSKKSTNAINIISGISMIGVAVATMALVVTMSVFNGFHDLVASFFTTLDPEIKITPVKGKTVAHDDPTLASLKQLPEVEFCSDRLEDMALAIYHDHQATVRIMGVDDNFNKVTGIESILYPSDGEYKTHAANLEFGVIGIRLAQELRTGVEWENYMHIYAPNSEGEIDITNPMDGFVEDSLLSPGAVFQVNQGKYDKDHIITSITFAQNLFNRQGEVSSVAVKTKAGTDISRLKTAMRKIAGDKFLIEDRYEQQAETYNIMQIEKFIAYIFLTFILLVACFNIIGSLSMLIIDKKADVATLRNLGASDKLISRIFLIEGGLISIGGAVIGVLIGLLLCLLQQQFGIVHLGSSEGEFIVNAYPVSVHYVDVAVIFITVVIVGWLSVLWPVKVLCRRLLG